MFVRATVALVGMALLGCITIILAEEYVMNIHKMKGKVATRSLA